MSRTLFKIASFLFTLQTALAQPSLIQSFAIAMDPGTAVTAGKGFQGGIFEADGKTNPALRVDLHLQCSQKPHTQSVVLTGSGVQGIGALIRMTLRDAETREIIFAKVFSMPNIAVKEFSELIPITPSRRRYRLVFEERWSEVFKGRNVIRGGSLMNWEGCFATVSRDSTLAPHPTKQLPPRPGFKVD